MERNKNSLAIIIIVALSVTNFTYQYFNLEDYWTAFERSYFQALAIFIYVLNDKLLLKGSKWKHS